MDTETGRHLLRIDGLMPLPARARIEFGLHDGRPATDTIMMKTRVWGAPSPKPLLILYVMLRPPGEDAALP